MALTAKREDNTISEQTQDLSKGFCQTAVEMTSYTFLGFALLGYGFFSLQTIFTWEILFYLMNPHFIGIFLFTLFYGVVLAYKQRTFNHTFLQKENSRASKSKKLKLEPLSHKDFPGQFNQLVMKKNSDEYRTMSQNLLRNHLRLYLFSITWMFALLTLTNTGRSRELAWFKWVIVPLLCLYAFFIIKRVKKLYQETSQKMIFEQVSVLIFLESLDAHGINFNTRPKTEKEKKLGEFLELAASLQPIHHHHNRKTRFNILHGIIDGSIGLILILLPQTGESLIYQQLGFFMILGTVIYLSIIMSKYLQRRELFRHTRAILEPFLIV